MKSVLKFWGSVGAMMWAVGCSDLPNPVDKDMPLMLHDLGGDLDAGQDMTLLDMSVAKTGTPCTSDGVCGALGTCLVDEPGGYCTTSCLDEGMCPEEGTECVSKLDGSMVCRASCDEASPCRSGYDCHQGLCIPQTNLQTPIGQECANDDACGDGFCAQEGFPQGYCTQECFDGDPQGCPDASSCVVLKDKGTCFASCTKNDDCRQGHECVGDQFCIPKLVALDVPVGDACTSDADCREGMCDMSKFGGYCTYSCNVLEVLCPEGARCVGGVGESSCLKTCDEHADCRLGYMCNQDNICVVGL